MARNNTPIIIGAVLFGLLALGLTFFVLSGGGGTPAPPQPTTPTVAAAPGSHWVAQRTIYPRTMITRDMLIERDNGAAGAPAGAILEPNDVLGKIAGRIIRPGETLTGDSITTPVARVIPANIPIPVGLRGVAVWVNPDETAAGLVDVGDRVDVVVTHELKVQKQGSQVIVGATDFAAGRTIAQDIEVLAVDPSIQQYRPGPAPATATGTPPATADGQPGAAPAPGATPGPAPVPTPTPAPNGPRRFIRVVLATTPADAQRIVAANRLGQIHLTIRNPNSRDRLAAGEAREYPSRAAGSARAADTAISAAERKEDKEREAGVEIIKAVASSRNQDRMTPAVPIMPPPSMNGTPTTIAPLPSYDKDVTVIRGTEKTRVIVPR